MTRVLLHMVALYDIFLHCKADDYDIHTTLNVPPSLWGRWGGKASRCKRNTFADPEEATFGVCVTIRLLWTLKLVHTGINLWLTAGWILISDKGCQQSNSCVNLPWMPDAALWTTVSTTHRQWISRSWAATIYVQAGSAGSDWKGGG